VWALCLVQGPFRPASNPNVTTCSPAVRWVTRSVCGTTPELQRLLLAIYRQIDDPDAIYSVLQGADAATQLCRHEHEGSWGRVLEGCDQILRVGSGASTRCDLPSWVCC
jgi:hypothetical protein